CLVFRHSCVNCPKKEKEIKKNQEVNKAIDCFVNVKSRKSKDDGIKSNNICIRRNMQQNNQKKPFQKKEVVSKFVYRQKQPQGVNIEQMKKVNEEHDKYNTPSGSIRKVWSMGENVKKDVRDTANKFFVLQEIEEETTMMKMNLRENGKVEKFVKEKIQPSIDKAKDWTKEMTEYFKEYWKEHYDKSMKVENEGTDIKLDENDVYIEKEGISKFITENEVKGQSMLYHVEILSSQKSFFCTFIYAANRGKDRRELWKDLRLYKKIMGDLAWTIMGDVNVSLNLKDHSEGISHFTQDMLEFQDCINEIEMEDINSMANYITDKVDFKDLVKKNWNMEVQFVKHFEGFLGISPEVAKFSREDSLLFEKKVSSEDAEIMIKEIGNDEIKKALFDIEDNKAPRPDGFTSRFFKKSWEIIKDDFCAAIKEFFESGKLLREINATLIALVPKSTTPQNVSDFRPISCCNATYDLIMRCHGGVESVQTIKRTLDKFSSMTGLYPN
nr:RNA-directed DNA polymerase, eukaryota, reverse transcriptase zinc-binding domain protein [Tanacetum cinerariifolium]